MWLSGLSFRRISWSIITKISTAKLWLIIGQIFASDRKVPHFNSFPSSDAGNISKVRGHKLRRKAQEKIFYCALPQLFRGAPMTGHYRKVQGTVTRTELGQRWSTVRGQSDVWLFKVTLCQMWPRQSIEHEAWVVSYRSSVDTNSVSCSISFRDVAPQSSNIFLANLGGPRPTLWRLEAVPLKTFGPPPITWLLLP